MLSGFYVFLMGIGYVVATAPDFNSNIVFYHSSTNISFKLTEAEQIFDNSNFVRSLPTVIYFHGFQSSPQSDSAIAIVNSYLQNGGFNILLLDWHELAYAFYPIASLNLDKLGTVVAQFILKLVAKGYPITKLHLVGHSLGAHLGGYAGNDIQSLSNNSLILPRITGLDPAGPDFFTLNFGTKPLDNNDALFVDIIHTDAGGFGAPVSTALVDFWPNGGRRPQPGCGIIGAGVCSHSRSVFLYAESVPKKTKASFTSESEANTNINVQMGLNCPTNAPPGNYELETNSKSPFSLG